jgi:hypothetical protein
MTIAISGLPSLTIPAEFFVGAILVIFVAEVIRWSIRGRR